MPNYIRAVAMGLAVAACLQASPALPAEDREGNLISPLDSERAVPTPLGMKPVSDRALATRRGGAEVASEMVLKGVVSDNRAINVATGGNSISEGALANTSGMPMIIQNTGNNVLIQNATIVNVQLK